MYIPKEAFFALKLILSLSIVCIVGGIAYPYYGLNYALWATGGFCLLLTPFAMRRSMQWSGFNSAQRTKSVQTLKEQALAHRCQPAFYECESFDFWAEQFLTSDEVQKLKEKYEEEKKVQEDPEPESSPSVLSLNSFYMAIAIAIGSAALALFLHKIGVL